MLRPHATTIKVRFNELDPYGHVNHAQYVSYFEHGRTEALELLGLGLHEMSDKGYQVVVLEITVAYKRAAVAGDVLTIETWISSLRRASTVWEQRILRGDEVCSTITVRAGITDVSGKPTRPPAWIFDAMRPLLVED